MTIAPEANGDIKLVLDAARAAVQQEFQIAERLDSKARNQLTVAGTWYALVTGLAGIALKMWIDTSSGSGLVAFIIVFAGAGAVCLIVALVYSYRVWRLRVEPDIHPDGIAEMLADVHDPGVDVAERLVEHYRALLAMRRASNKIRSTNFKASVKWWLLALGFGLAELVTSLAAIAHS